MTNQDKKRLFIYTTLAYVALGVFFCMTDEPTIKANSIYIPFIMWLIYSIILFKRK